MVWGWRPGSSSAIDGASWTSLFSLTLESMGFYREITPQMAELFGVVEYYNLIQFPHIFIYINQQEYELNQRIIDTSGLHTG